MESTFFRHLKVLVLLSGLFLSPSLIAQPMEVIDGATNPYDPINLITNIFLGEGVEVLNVTYTGDPLAVGYFQNAEDEIGIDRGIVMTSGAAADGVSTGVANPGSSFASYGNSGPTGDPDLDILVPGLTKFNVARYEITFIPTSDTLRFRYSWASEEYPEYACTSFNDVFGFFISGPGISGPYTNNSDNIALVPGTNLPVAIDNVHPQNGAGCPPVNEQFYNDNNGSAMMPVYDGYTDVFIAEAVVIPCEEYTIRLVISDAGDQIFDSGVFLEAKSFGTGALDVDIATVSLDGTITEGCSDATLTFSLPTPAESDYPIDYTIFGDATNGIDYTTIPLDLTIMAGDSTISVPVAAFEDGIDEGTEFIGIDVQRDICNRDTFYIYIRENELISPDLGPDTLICTTDTIQLDGTVNITLPPPPSFSNTNDFSIEPTGVQIMSPVTVVGIQPFELGPGVIQSVCVNIEHNWLDDLDLFLQGPNGAFMELSTDNGSNGDDYINTCFTPTAGTNINYIDPPASGAPYTGNFAPEGFWEDLWSAQENPSNGEWNLLVIDDANGFTGTLFDWTITFEPLYQIFYTWTPSTGLSCDDCPDPLATPDTTTTYILTAYDSYGCEVYDTITVNVVEALPAPEVFCGTITADCITFQWNDVPGAIIYEVSTDGGVTWEIPNGLFEHTICGLGLDEEVTILVRALDGCNGVIGSATCSTPPCLALNPSIESIVDVTCNGGADGSMELSATGDFPPFTFTLGLETNSTGIFTDLPANAYMVTIEDSEGCTVEVPVTVNQPLPLDINPVVINDVTCNGDTDGTATTTVSGGNYPYAYDWDGGMQFDSVAVNLGEGTHTVVITDALGCITIQNVTIDEPAALDLDLSATLINCFGDSTGTATVEVVGGAGSYTFDWGANSGNQSDSIAVNLPAGFYDVVVIDDNGCSTTEQIEVIQYPEITLDSSSTDASCSGILNGTASVSANGGGIGIFTYQWDANANNQSSATAVDLGPGTYTVTVSDLFGCEVETTVTVDSPNDLEILLTVDSTSCNNTLNGTASLDVSGGTPFYTYVWSDGGPNQPDRDDLASGPATVTITDINGCQEIIDFNIEAPEALVLEMDSTDVDCFGNSTGTASVIASGGSPDYQYSWGDLQDTPTAIDLPSGPIGVTVTDANGCSETSTVEILEPEVLEVDLSATDALCFEEGSGTATVVATGGVGGYTYEWEDLQDTPTALDLIAGVYAVVVTDANNCTATGEIEVFEPSELTITANSTPVSCMGGPDGTATASPDGGTGPYTYTWSDNQQTQTATALDAGMYTVTVTDFNGCEATTMVELVAPEDVEISIDFTDVSCNGGDDGTALILIDAGTAPFIYGWSNGDDLPNLDDLPAGVYTVTVTDFNGCETVETIEIEEPEALSATLEQTSSLCNDGNDGTASINTIFYGSTPANIGDFTFSWNTIPVQNGATATGLLGGQTYTVIITDPLGCTITEEITVDNPAPIEVLSVGTEDVSCADGADGTATVAADGGTAPYTYQWDSSTGNQIGADAADLAAGTYTVVIIDDNGCTTTASAIVLEPAPLDLEYTTDDVDCFGEATGSAEATGDGGIGPYTYEWSSGSIKEVADGLSVGIYEVTMTDANGCEIIEEVEINQPEAPVTAVGGGKDVECFGGGNGTISVDAQGGTPPYSYSLDNDLYTGSSTLVALEAGFYNVFVKDANGCTVLTSEIEINEPDPIEVDLGADIELEYGETYQLEALITPASSVSYNWWLVGPGELDCVDCATPIIDPLGFATTIFVAVTNENGCIAEDLVRIYVEKERYVVVPTGFSPNGDGENDLLLVHGQEGVIVENFQVFDRWGELLYQSGGFEVNQTQVGWNGEFRSEPMGSGVYIWYMEVVYPDGSVESLKGSTTLIR